MIVSGRVACCVIALSFLYVSCSCSGTVTKKETSVYQSVYAENILDQSTEKIKYFEFGTSPEFIIENNILYLLIQTSRTKLSLYVEANVCKWDVKRLKDFISNHQELQVKLPDPKANDGGIRWLSGR